MAATLTTALTGEEITILKSYKRSRFSLVQHKAEALLLLEDGVTLDIIARFVERQPSTITTWITDFNRLRTASLFTGHAANTNVGRYPDKNITIVWDNARWHRSKKLREHLGEGNPLANVHLVWLPPYAPDHNPIEKVWNEAKAAISNRQRLVFEDTCIGFETFIGSSAFFLPDLSLWVKLLIWESYN